MYSPQKLHPISYLTALIKVIKQNILTFIVFIGFNVWNFDFTEIRHYIGPAIFIVIVLLASISKFIDVRVTRYWIEDEHFIITSGWFNKKRKELNISRIQSLDTTQGLINQIVGGVSLQIKTPSDGVELSTISKSQSDLIEQAIRKRQLELKGEVEVDSQDNIREEALAYSDDINETTPNQHLESKPIFKMSFGSLLLMAMTSGAIGVAFATISPIIGAFQDVIPWTKWTENLWHWIDSVSLIVITCLAFILIISYIIGTLITLIRYHNYTVSQQDSQLKISYGLLNVKNITVPTNRLQAVLEKQSFLRRLFGYTSIHFIITSDLDVESEDDVSNNGKIMILPFIKRKEAYNIIESLVPEMQFSKVHKGMPWRGYHRHFFIPSLILIIATCFATYYWSAWSILITVAIIVLMVIHALIYVRSSGLHFENEEIALRQVSLFGFNTYYFKTDKIIGMETNQHPLLERSQLSNLHFILAKGSIFEDIHLKFISETTANYYINAYLRGEYNE